MREMEKHTRLKREASLLQVITYGVGNIIGAGIYVLVGVAAGLSGNAIGLSFLTGAFVAFFTCLSYAELSAMYPRAASEYLYLGRAYGNRAFSFMTEWMMIVAEAVAVATVSLGFAQYFQTLFAFPVELIAVALLLSLTLISIAGIRVSLKLNGVLSVVAILGLLVVIAAGIGKIGTVDYFSSPTGMSGVFAASALVFFAYLGFDNIANLAEETKNPKKTLPKGLMIAMGIATLLYILVGLSAVSLVPWQELSTSEAPLALVVSKSFGPLAYYALTIIALLTTFNTALVLLIAGSRAIYGMARERALPKFLEKVDSRTCAPVFASVVFLFITLLFLPIGNIGTIAEIASAGSLTVFALVNLSVLHLRRTAPHLKRPFRAPLNISWFSITALLGFFSCIGLLSRFNTDSLLLGLTLPISGIILHLIFKRGRILEVDGELMEKHE
jgi:basic amino acid/polyamine antiporter, APA family